jgi:hypothetical protein
MAEGVAVKVTPISTVSRRVVEITEEKP